jgi:hypothetical protein
MSKELTAREAGALKRTIRSTVLNILADSHPEQFQALMDMHYGEAGLGKYVPEPTPEQKAAEKLAAEKAKALAQVEDLIERFPSLADQIRPVVAVPTHDPDDAVEDPRIAADAEFIRAARG